MAVVQHAEDRHVQDWGNTLASVGCIAEAPNKVRLIAAGPSLVRLIAQVGNA